jgi:hypothetical protein
LALTHHLAAFSQVMQIRMTYLYRDGGNYKQWHEVVFSNSQNLSVATLTAEIKKYLHSGQFFESSLAPEPFVYENTFDPELDHSWLEFDSFEETKGRPNVNEDIAEFIEKLAKGLPG